MSEASRAVLKGVRITPRKARLVVDMVRGKPVQYALDLLKLTNKKAAPILFKMIESAIANAQVKSTVDVDRLIVSEGFVNGGADGLIAIGWVIDGEVVLGAGVVLGVG